MKENENKTMSYMLLMVAVLFVLCVIGLLRMASEKHEYEHHSLVIDSQEVVDSIEREYEAEMDTFFAKCLAFAMVESCDNPDAVSADGRYVGWLQIGKSIIDEINNRLGYEAFSYSDRESKEGSMAIWGTAMALWNPNYDMRRACEIWNPTAGEYYYNKVNKWYERILSEGIENYYGEEERYE